MRVIEGTEFQFDLEDLAFIGKGETIDYFQLILSYKQGLKEAINFTTKEERNSQYEAICKLHYNYYNK